MRESSVGKKSLTDLKKEPPPVEGRKAVSLPVMVMEDAVH